MERLWKLVTHIEQVCEKWLNALSEPPVAKALHARFGPAAGEIEATRALVAKAMFATQGRNRLPDDLLRRLHEALARLSRLAAYTPAKPRQTHDPLPLTVVSAAGQNKAAELETSMRKLLKRLRNALLGLGLSAGMALALPAAAAVVGDTVVNPGDGTTSTVVEAGSGYLITDTYVMILTNLTKLKSQDVTDETQVLVDDPDKVGDPNVADPRVTAKVVGVTLNTTTNMATSIRVEDSTGKQWDVATYVDKGANAAPLDTPGAGATTITQPTASGDIGVVQDVRVAGSGSNGRNGWGFKVLGVVIGQSAGAGGDGQNGQNFTHDVYAVDGPIEVVSDNLSGIELGSIGGAGGRGGNAVLSFNINGGAGGAAGAGGTVTITNRANITTGTQDGASGTNSHGMHIFSQSGVGGVAGTVQFGIAKGGKGGKGNSGGDVLATNYGTISTTGNGANGMFVQSMGGESGSGGSSYGIVGIAGSSQQAGDGGDASGYNYGRITTGGRGAHGLAVQSIGGTGGKSGDAKGIVALGDDGEGTGGNGGTALAVNGTGGIITTTGDDSYGIMAQSIGGGGGDAGYAGGLVGLGTKGSAAGNGGTADVRLIGTGSVTTTGEGSYGLFAQSVGGGGGNGGSAGALVGIGGGGKGGGTGGLATVTTAADTSVTTSGTEAHAVFAQSIGGGGGSGGASGALVSIGGKGDGGGIGGKAKVDNSGDLTTTGDGARGIFAQSVGGGGGSANGSNGLVAVGGGAGAGSAGGEVEVINRGTIRTGDASLPLDAQKGTDGIFAQSIGGGGGAGSATGGLVALGGTGGGGGAGGAVSVTNLGTIVTQGMLGRGIFAQSIGGGGGSGGNSGGAISIGGKGGTGVLSTGGAVTVNNDGAITTHGDKSSAIFAQSVGGGGGDGGSSKSGLVAIGGSGNDGGQGGVVTVKNKHNLTTTGDDAAGIFAQSVGGGGGNGGASISASAFAGVSVGGKGGAASNGGEVNLIFADRAVDLGGPAPVMISPLILTKGERSTGIFAQSVGGGGGNGGYAAQGTLGYGLSVAVAVGGAGGAGGNGGKVTLGTPTVRSDVVVRTEGDQSPAIFAQSVGGGGGNGGFAVALSLSGSATGGTASVSVGLGGSGGAGGAGEKVTLNMGGGAYTVGAFSPGLIAQSIGGGGGNGGFSLSIAGAAGNGGGMAVGVGLGGSGGTGGRGGVVDVRYDGDITTAGYSSTGALIQSVGGGGGNGGFNISGAVGISTSSMAVGVGLGGAGGGGGNADEVWGFVNGKIQTGLLGRQSAPDGTPAGDLKAALDNLKSIQSAGLIVQSVGGGGGNGGFNIAGSISAGTSTNLGVSVGLGGAGGGAGNGGKVHAGARDIITNADQSPGFLAQSVGGGGGSGGMNISGAIGISTTLSPAIAVGLGGSGGGGGYAEAVDAKVTGAVITSGNDSDAITAQSVGGGGGAGGLNVSGGVSLSGQNSFNVGVSIGGAGGKGGTGGTVDLKVNEGVANANRTLLAASTTGDGSNGIIAQSVGGGGGNGGISVAGGLAISASAGGNIMVGLGGAGGGAGNGKAVTGLVNGDVFTYGEDADGILMQSLGGAGGNGGINVSGGIAATADIAGNITVGIGGSGGKGGDGGTVNGEITGDVQTGWVEAVGNGHLRHGDGASGVTFQSLGGGGGNGGINVSGGVALSMANSPTGNIGVGIGGFAGDAAHGSAVDGTMHGNVTTYGDNAYGVLVQSAGGAGGAGGMNITGGISASAGPAVNIGVGLGGFGGKGGDSVALPNELFVTQGDLYGDVTTWGKDSFGAAFQSMGGGGGVGAINVTGNISFSSSSGAGAIGVGLGGFGGNGGKAGNVDGYANGAYVTHGDRSVGVISQSVGGGGGNGGMNITGNIAVAMGSGSTAGSFSFGLGGFGGKGGEAGQASLVRIGNTHTYGDDSHAVLVQSVGGGGGNGGINVSGDLDLSKGAAGSLSVGIGGFGGVAGDAKAASALVIGDVWAHGDGNGILVQSVGGGGGSGGINVSGQINFGSDTGRGLAFGLGGFGSAGGDASTATLTQWGTGPDNRAQVTATGDKRSAVVVQSIGGGGGDGGINITGGLAGDGVIALGVGGFGKAGGEGKAATANINADLFATGAQSRGLLVQSVGGGGGAGGFNITAAGNNSKELSLAFGMGGHGGAGNIAGNVLAVHRGQILVNGLNASGLVAQSIGGGGGDGGFNVALDVNIKEKGNAIAFGLGGFGGDGANAGTVTVDNVGSIFVNNDRPETGIAEILNGKIAAEDAMKLADHSHALLAQSIGGGGGEGGVNITAAIAPKKGNVLAIGVGGYGGSGGSGNVVDVSQGWETVNGAKVAAPGLLRTYGDGSIALLAQSVGGGGGDAGMNITVPFTYNGKADDKDAAFAGLITVGGDGGAAGTGNTVTVRHNGNILTGYADSGNTVVGNGGNGSGGILAQSIGGGGGNAAMNIGLGLTRNASALGIAVGGGTGSGGNAGKVFLYHEGGVFTNGDDAAALMAQSVGGGGGNTTTNMATTFLSNDTISATIGRLGGLGGEGQEVYVDSKGTLATHGDRSEGILAQSIGGGGGKSGTVGGGLTITNPDGKGSIGGKVAVGLPGGDGGLARKVEVRAAGLITTDGDDSYAIHAQSIGGGGGVGGMALNTVLRTQGSFNVAVGGMGGFGSNGGEVKVYNAAELLTGGENAAGIYAQSIGGGGGTGGNAGTMGIAWGGPKKDDQPHMNLAAAVGGKGGEGGTGGVVLAENTGVIKTTGRHAAGIRAESIGGGGGFGGTILTIRTDTALKSSMTGGFNIGGQGTKGGYGQLVTVNNKGGSIWTTGDQSSGISAASIGGGGGEGGGVADFQLASLTGNGTYTNLTLNIGGDGGNGGTAGKVVVTNTTNPGVAGSGQIVTEGANAYGIFAQSLGGGGGNGGAVFSVLVGKGNENSASLGINVGGKGDYGGWADTVTVRNSGLIYTKGANSHGIVAQSIGGGGGNGAMAIAGALLIKAPMDSPLVAIGGKGGNGGSGNYVFVENTGNIVTEGKNANGILAQSIGGGGGNNAMGFSASGNPATLLASNALAALIGGLDTSKGGTGGKVRVENKGAIITKGEGATAIVAESINGGGGHLSFDFGSIEHLFDLACVPAPDIIGDCMPGTGGKTGDRPVGQPNYAVQVGAKIGSDMNGGLVEIVNTGSVGSTGAHGAGMKIVSVGGGGGRLDLKMIQAKPSNYTATTSARVAALGFSAAAETIVAVAYGVNLGSIGGTDAAGGVLDSDQTGEIFTDARFAMGLQAQSIGGGGGQAVMQIEAPEGTRIGTVDAALGSATGLRQTGGAVGHIQRDAILTGGDWSIGAQVQSIGGGGGIALIDLNATDQTELLTRLTLGANGGTELAGGNLTGSYNGLLTEGDHSVGLLAQSIGAGGGTVLTAGSDALNVTFGGKANATGTGGSIILSNANMIGTMGVGSHGLVLQSIGGGGGAVFTDASAIQTTLNAGNRGDGGLVDFTQSADVIVMGDRSYGVIAQSLGGGGGWVDGSFAGSAGGTGSGGRIDLTFEGSVIATGTDSVAIFAQSLGKSGTGNIDIDAQGAVRGYAEGIHVDGGKTNTLTLSGAVSAVSGLAINTGTGDDRVINTGAVIGDIDLGSGSNVFENHAGAIFIASKRIDLTDSAIGGNMNSLAMQALLAAPVSLPGGTFSNDGEFNMGLSASPMPIDLSGGEAFADLDAMGDPSTNLMYGQRVINTVDLDGNFVQGAQGHMAFDVAFGTYASDRVNVTGNTTVAGTGDVVLTWLENTAPVTLFATAGTAVDNGLDIRDTMAIDYRIVADQGGIKLVLDHDFAQPFLNRNGRALGTHMDAALNAGSSGLGRVLALFGNIGQGNEALYSGLIDEMNPEAFLAPQLIQLSMAQQFATQLTPCDLAGQGKARCVWGRMVNTDARREADSESFGYHAMINGFESGFQQRIDNQWSVSMALGYASLDRLTAAAGRAQMKGDGFHAGGSARRTLAGGTQLDFGLTGGIQSIDSQRLVQVFGPDVATATPEFGYAMALARISHQYDRGSLFVRPGVGLSVTALRQNAFKEAGLGGEGAAGVEHTQTFASLMPDLTVGYHGQDATGTTTALSFTLGAVAHSIRELSMPYRLSGANPQSDVAWIGAAFDPVTVRYGINLQVTGKEDRASVNLSFANETGRRSDQQTLSLSARWRF